VGGSKPREALQDKKDPNKRQNCTLHHGREYASVRASPSPPSFLSSAAAALRAGFDIGLI
jgi:hypothetical protein